MDLREIPTQLLPRTWVDSVDLSELQFAHLLNGPLIFCGLSDHYFILIRFKVMSLKVYVC